MDFSQRLMLAVAIVLVDTVVFVIPVTSFFLAYLLLSRPPWFRDWVLKLYSDL
ncbi:MAG: hypothetical protein NC930_05645 [Candidatus Omnitrophica bacterium]|nr:hypothetical protein [Candidatus Omnitrophota bacterium]